MKHFFFTVVLYFTVFSCSNIEQKNLENNKCLPGLVLIGYLGEDDKPKYPLIIRSSETDTSYLNVIGLDQEKFTRNGFVISKEYYHLSTVKPEAYSTLKNYIVANNTHKNKTVFNADYNTLKILLFDKCDTLSYTVNKSDSGYFSKMIDTLGLKEEDTLWGYINYYHSIQIWDGRR